MFVFVLTRASLSAFPIKQTATDDFITTNFITTKKLEVLIISIFYFLYIYILA